MSGHVTPLSTTTLDVSTPSAAHTRPPLGVKTSFSPLKPSSLPPSPPPPTSAYPYIIPLISRLPPELLHLVFELVKSEVCAEYEAAPTEKEGSKKPDWMAWRAVTQVCQRWRRIALASSTLWREIKFRRVGLSWGLEMLSRARSAPLKIELGHAPGYKNFPSESSSLTFASKLLEDEGHRLQTFTLFGVEMDVVAAMLFVAEDGKYKCLEDLQVETRWDDVRISFDVLRRTMPRLRELRLYGPIITRAPTAPLEHLTHLNLQHDPKPTDDPPIATIRLTTGILLPEILRSLPVLVDLQLTDVFPPDEMLDCIPPIPLPRTCQTINLTTRKSTSQAVRFSRLLHHPSAVREYVLQDCSPSQLSSLLSSYAGSPERSPRQVGIVIGHPKKSVTVSVCYEAWMRSPPVDARLPRHAFSVTFSDREELWEAMCGAIDFRNVQDVAFEDDSLEEKGGVEDEDDEEEEELDEEEVERLVEMRRVRARMRWKVFLTAPVRRIRVTGSACQILFSILSSPPECTLCHSPSTSTSTTTTCDHLPSLFPLLTELCVVESVERPGVFGPAPFEQGKDLVEAVRNRQRRCGGLMKEVKVPDRFLYDAWVDEVLGEVGRVSNSRYRYF